MRAGSIDMGPLAGVRKAVVERWNTYGTLGMKWVAWHDCGWTEELTEWHNAFWAADHHVRYDCGRREQPSSGKYAVPRDWDKGEAWAKARADVVAEAISRGAYIPPENRYTTAYEGGMQNTPTPSHMGFPLRGAYTEAPTTDLGAITTEVQGFAAGAVPRAIGADRQGHTGWWAGLWGRARA